MRFESIPRRVKDLFFWVARPIPLELPEPDRSRARSRRRRLIFGAFLILFALSLLTWMIVRPINPEISIGNDVALALVVNSLIILLLLFVMLVARQLLNLYFERAAARGGSRFQTKLIVSFLLMTIAPSAVMFIVAYGMVSEAVDRWLNARVGTTLARSLEVVEHYQKEMSRSTESVALDYAKRLKGVDLEKGRDSIARLGLELAGAGGLDSLQVYSDALESLSISPRSPVGYNFSSSEREEITHELGDGAVLTERVRFEGRTLFVSVAPILGSDSNERSGYVVAARALDDAIDQNFRAISSALESHERFKLQKEIIKATYTLTLALVALVVIFSSNWVGFQLARGITEPLERLSEATARIARGSLDQEIEIKARDDEVGRLIADFNKMTRDLKFSEEKVRRTHLALTESNEELKRRTRYIETVLDNIGAGVISLDRAGLVTTMNRSAARILGVSRKAAIGRRYNHVFDKSALTEVRRLLKDRSEREPRKYFERELTIDARGSMRTLKAVTSFLSDETGQYLGSVVVIDDLTELIEARRAQAIEDMARALAHEIKNPLTPIKLNTQRMVKKFAEGAPDFGKILAESSAGVIKEVDSLKALLERFSQLAKSSRPTLRGESDQESRLAASSPLAPALFELELKPTRLNELIEDLAQTYRAVWPDLIIELSFDERIDLVSIDADQIRRCLINLLKNARDSIGENPGRVEIVTKMDDATGRIVIDLSDSGAGVGDAIRSRIFDINFSTKRRGAGLGLAIVRRIVEDHGGSIEFFERRPSGALFRISLPIMTRAV